jgi:hypothetical protein
MACGLFDRHPRLRIILGHMGEGLPYSMWRVDHRNGWVKAPPKHKAKKKICDYFNANFFLTTSGNFRTQTLIDAMLDRWAKSYAEEFDRIAGANPDPVTTIRAHIEATRRSDASSNANAKAASLMATLLQTPEHLASTRRWYRQRLAALDTGTEEGRRARLALLATEGAFTVRFLGLMDMDENEWTEVMEDIAAMLR